MLLLTNEKTPLHSLWGALAPTLAAMLFSIFGMQALAQEPMAQPTQSAIPLADLLQEAEKNNPQIEAARQGWQAAKQVPTQVSTLPDPEFQIQQVNV